LRLRLGVFGGALRRLAYDARVRGSSGPRLPRPLRAHGHRLLTAALICASCSDGSVRAPAGNDGNARATAAPVIHVAAASDVTRAFEELGRVFAGKTGQKVAFTFGASGMLAKQLREGAPFDVFASANSAFVDEVLAAGACERSTRALYAHGHLVVWSKRGVQPAATLTDLADPRFRRIAIANPAHAPYGTAAKQALENRGLWAALEPRIVYGENNRQAHQFAQSGNAEAALVALSLVIGTSDGAYTEVDQALHAPIDQTLVACLRGKNAAGGRAFASFVASRDGRALMRRYGFLMPGASPQRAP
jgi:molybdate transport system substrate-binding protein